jgi:hypothetical protein
MNRLNEPIMNRLNEPIMNQIEVSTTVFNKIYRCTEIHYGNISKSFIYITVEVEIYDARLQDISENRKNIKKNPLHEEEEEGASVAEEEEEEEGDKEEEEENRLNNHNFSDCNHDSNNLTKPKPLLNINKINNIVNNVKVKTNKKVKIIPIEKKLNIIIEKITNKLQLNLMKEYMNYILILEHSKKQNSSYKDKINAFYYVILNKIESSL